jgi:hypothetical protein
VIGPPVMKKMTQIFLGPKEVMEVKEAGHFVQEWGEEVAKRAVAFFRKFDKGHLSKL